ATRYVQISLVSLPSPLFFSFNDPAPPAIYSLSLHDALPISYPVDRRRPGRGLPALPGKRHRDKPALRPGRAAGQACRDVACQERSEEHTSELQSLTNLVCRLLLEKKNTIEVAQKSYLNCRYR